MTLLSLAVACLAFRQDDAPNGDYGGFYTWPEIAARLAELERRHPERLSRASLGKTWEGRDIPLLKVSDHAARDEDEPEILLMAGIHPREQQPQICLMNLLEELLDGYGKDERLTRLVDGREIWILPVLNVDGKVYDMKNGNGRDKGAGWRKNRRPHPGGGPAGVDLNRNFPVRWGGSSDEEKSEVFEGPHPLSEPESRALAKFFDERPLRAFVDLHSSMKAIFHPGYLIGPEHDRYTALTRRMRELQQDPYAVTRPDRDADPPVGQRPGNTGLTHAWGYYTRGVYSFIFEIAGKGFYPDPEEIHREYRANVREPLLYLLEACADLPPAGRGTATLTSARLDRRLTPGQTAGWTPSVEGACDYGVLVSEDPALQVLSEFRVFPVKAGFTVTVSKKAKPGQAVPVLLYLWDRERRLSVVRTSLTVEPP
jgi:hypothetical protein